MDGEKFNAGNVKENPSSRWTVKIVMENASKD